MIDRSRSGIGELVAAIITVIVGIILTVSFGWMVSAVATPILAFLLLRLGGMQTKILRAEVGIEALCKSCGGKLTWIPQHSRYYCHQCGKYPPTCPTCGKDLFWIPQYDRLYCKDCQSYAEDLERLKKPAARKEKPRRTRMKRDITT